VPLVLPVDASGPEEVAEGALAAGEAGEVGEAVVSDAAGGDEGTEAGAGDGAAVSFVLLHPCNAPNATTANAMERVVDLMLLLLLVRAAQGPGMCDLQATRVPGP
jgi:hypothetical protein